MPNGLDSLQGKGLWDLAVCKDYQEVSKVTTWKQMVNKIHIEYDIKIVCYARQKLIVRIIIKRSVFSNNYWVKTHNKNSHCPLNKLSMIYKL